MLDRLERFRTPLLFLAGFAIAVVVWLLVERAHDATRPLELVAMDAPPGGLKVQVTGAVRQPGVYRFDPGARIADAIEAAGGPAPDAALGALNLAARLRDEQRLVIPTEQQARAAPSGAGGRSAAVAPAADGTVDLNTADQRTLESLPGIGPARARAIIDSRQAEGPFALPEDLLERSLVPRSVFDQIRSRLAATLPR